MDHCTHMHAHPDLFKLLMGFIVAAHNYTLQFVCMYAGSFKPFAFLFALALMMMVRYQIAFFGHCYLSAGLKQQKKRKLKFCPFNLIHPHTSATHKFLFHHSCFWPLSPFLFIHTYPFAVLILTRYKINNALKIAIQTKQQEETTTTTTTTLKILGPGSRSLSLSLFDQWLEIFDLCIVLHLPSVHYILCTHPKMMQVTCNLSPAFPFV